jgi:hypothetical protein
MFFQECSVEQHLRSCVVYLLFAGKDDVAGDGHAGGDSAGGGGTKSSMSVRERARSN